MLLSSRIKMAYNDVSLIIIIKRLIYLISNIQCYFGKSFLDLDPREAVIPETPKQVRGDYN